MSFIFWTHNRARKILLYEKDRKYFHEFTLTYRGQLLLLDERKGKDLAQT